MSNDVSALVEFYSKRENVDPLLVKSIIYHESRGNAMALSPVGAVGLMQVMPDTAKFVGVDPSKLYTPEQNIKAGILYLSFLRRKFGADVEKIVAAYNAGHGAVQKYGGIPPYRETVRYTSNVLSTYMKYKGMPFSTMSMSKGRVDSVNSNSSSVKPFLVVVDGQNSVAKSYSRVERGDSKAGIRPSIAPANYVRSKSAKSGDGIRSVSNKTQNRAVTVQNNSSATSVSKDSNFLQIISAE